MNGAPICLPVCSVPAASFCSVGGDYGGLVVMDSDGEDAPGYIPAFADALAATGAERIVFAERRKRAEGLAFRVGYRVYRAAFRALTYHSIAFGNFSCIPRGLLARVARLPGKLGKIGGRGEIGDGGNWGGNWGRGNWGRGEIGDVPRFRRGSR